MIVGAGPGRRARPPRRCAPRASTGRSCCSATSPSSRTSGRRCPRATCWARTSATAAFVHPPSWYAEHDVDLRLGTAATGVDPAGAHGHARRRRAARATTSCCWPPASAPRRLPVPGADLDGVLPAHASPTRRLRDALRAPAPRVVVIGAGWIGLEVAAAAREHGAEVTRRRGGAPAAAARPGRRGRRGLRRPAPRARRRPPLRHARASRGAGGRVAAVVARGRHRAARRRGRGRDRRRARTPSSPSTAGLDVDERRRSSTSPCARPTPTSTPPATWPTRTTRCWASGSASSTGPTPSTAARPPRASMLGQRARLRPACRTSSPTSTTSAWSTPATSRPAATTRWSFRGDVAAREFIAFWLSGRPGAGRHERQRLGRHRPDPGADPPGHPVDPARLTDPTVSLTEI